MVEDEKIDKDELWKFYEKAIEGRNVLYSQYLKYVNLYAIFTGALFVAFYNLVNKSDYLVFTIAIAILGLISSILWMCSVKGYYAWIVNWITIVRFYEKNLNFGKNLGESRFVYGLFYEANQKKCFITDPSRFSTQKLTLLFIFSSIMGWVSCFLLAMCKWLQENGVVSLDVYRWCGFFTILVMLAAFIYVLFKIFSKSSKDEIDSHYRLVAIPNSNKEIVEASFSICLPKNKGV